MKELSERHFDRLMNYMDSVGYDLTDENDRSFIFFNNVVKRHVIVGKWRLDSKNKEFCRFLCKLENHIKGGDKDET